MTQRKTPSMPVEDDVPKDLDAERALLGSILVDGLPAFRRAAAIVTADDFYDPRHRGIFRAMMRLAAAGAEIDPVTVTAAFADGGPH